MEYTDYRSLLKNEYKKRALRNPSYSLRAFSRDIGISQSRLSGIFNFRQGLSETVALDIAERLKMPEETKNIFTLMVKSEHSRSSIARQLASQELQQKYKIPILNLSSDKLNKLTDWYHMALLTYLEKKMGHIADMTIFSQELSIPADILTHALNVLIDLGLVQLEDNIVRRVSTNLYTSSETPDEAIKKFQKQAFSHIAQSLGKIEIQRKHLDTCFFLCSAEEIIKIKKLIEDFVSNLILQFHQPHAPNAQVQQISVGLIPLQNKNGFTQLDL